MKRRRKGITPLKSIRGWIKVSVLAAVLTMQTALGGMVSHAVVYVYEDDEEEDDRLPFGRSSTSGSSTGSTSTGRSTRNVEIGLNGGADGWDEIETNSVILDEPLVNQVTLKEQYNEDYRVYEESMADVFFFYSNVGNGGITHESVFLDIPQNLSYTIEMNGVPWDYIPGQPISDYGTYVVRLTGIEDENVPLYEQKEYQAVFRFRIQQKPPKETEESREVAVEAGAPAGMEWQSYTYDGRPLEEESEERQDVFRVSGAANGQSEEVKEESGESLEDNTAASGSREGLEENEEGLAGNEEGLAGNEESLGNEELAEGAQDGSDSQEGRNEESGEGGKAEPGSINNGFISRTQDYDAASKRYHVTFSDGLELVSNVPEGYIGPDAVEVSVSPAGRESLVLYRDDEPIDYVHGDSFTEPGHYRLEVNGQPWSCTITSYLKEASVFAAPAGLRFTSAVLNGEPLELSSDRYVWLEEDGAYQFVLEGENGAVLHTGLAKDSEPPQVEVKLKGGNATIQYLSEDIEEILLERDGEAVEGFSGYSVSQPGSYRLVVRDKAGNEAEAKFSLSYRVNRYGIIAVVLLILLAAGGVAFVVHTKRSVRIR